MKRHVFQGSGKKMDVLQWERMKELHFAMDGEEEFLVYFRIKNYFPVKFSQALKIYTKIS